MEIDNMKLGHHRKNGYYIKVMSKKGNSVEIFEDDISKMIEMWVGDIP